MSQDALRKTAEYYCTVRARKFDQATGESASLLGPYWPFDNYRHPYAGLIAERNAAVREPPGFFRFPGLITDGKLRAWDVATQRPATALRGKDPVIAAKAPVLHKCNDGWAKTLEGLRYVGALKANTSPVRPAGPWIFDLVTHPEGGRLFDIALALAHLRGAECDWKSPYPYGGPVAQTLPACVAEVVLAYLLGLPVRLDESWYEGAVPTLPHGIAVLTETQDIMNPTLKVPAITRGCPVPDHTLTCVLASVVQQAAPDALVRGVTAPGQLDHWACAPTIVAFAGYEHIDYICHAELGVHSENYSKDPFYVVPVADLIPMDYLRGLTGLCRAKDVCPQDREVNWVYLGDPEIDELLAESPVWPTKEAFQIPTAASDAPERPTYRARSKGDLHTREQKKWIAQHKNAFALVQTAVEREAGQREDIKTWKKARAERRKNWRARQKRVRERKRLIQTIWADRLGRPLSDAQAERLRQARHEHKDKYPEFVADVLRTTENPYGNSV